MRVTILLFILIYLLPVNIDAQPARFSRIEITPSFGAFRISNDAFSRFYDNRWLYPAGVSIDYALNPSLHLNVRAKFSQKNSSYFDEDLNENVDLKWEQSWFGIGIQRFTSSPFSKSRSYFGFGFAFFQIDENKEGYLLRELSRSSSSTNPKGFFICGGFDRPVSSKINFRFEIEATSAGVGDGFGFESQSLGGIYIGLGINFNLL
ncbi:hypothetical protein IIC38_02340 [candidate division KSB1 bacterium]|nr:hypothetical protein [candidate division KSB1 bacterium]